MAGDGRRAAERFSAELAAFAFRTTLLDGADLLEAKYDPAQPRWPAGRSDGGQWRAYLGQARRWFEVSKAEIDEWLVRNRDPITRVFGGLQAVGGGFEIVDGVVLVGGGAATSEVGVGIPVAALGAWSVTNGYDNVVAGWNALLTGRPQDTNLRKTLRAMGLTDAQADATELLLGGFSAGAIGRLTRREIEAAALRGLQRRALNTLKPVTLPVSYKGVSIWKEPDIRARGLAWEEFDRKRTGYDPTPTNYDVIDQISRNGRVVVSNKTIDITSPTYTSTERNALSSALKRHTDSLAGMKLNRRAPLNDKARLSRIRERRLHVLLPAGRVLPGQAAQIAGAETYANERGIKLVVEYAP